MNTRLEIASRVLAGMLAHDRNEHTIEVNARGAIAFADALISADEATREDEPTDDQPFTLEAAHGFMVEDITRLRQHVLGMLHGTEGRVAQLNTISRSLDVILAKDNARMRDDHGRNVVEAQLSHDGNPR